MARTNMTDLLSFAAVAQDRSFTRAAKRLGVTRSALSHAMNGLETRLGLARLLHVGRCRIIADGLKGAVGLLAGREDELAGMEHGPAAVLALDAP